MDNMKITKIVGGLCGALLIFLLLKWGGETIYHVSSGNGHDGHSAQSSVEPASIYANAVTEEAPVKEEGASVLELVALADAKRGAKIFSKCKACHAKVSDGANRIGPHLFDIVDRKIGSIAGYNYSSVLVNMGGDWTMSALDGFLTDPRKYAPGTKMTFSGLKKAQDRINLIAYLNTLK